MKKKLLISAGILMLAGFANEAYSVPASPKYYPYRQPDGTTIMLSQRGDENFHYFVDADGYPVMLQSDGSYRYIDVNGEVSPTLVTTKPQENKLRKKFENTKISPSEIINKYIDTNKPQIVYKNVLTPKSTLAEGDKKVLVILLEFADREFTNGDYEHFYNMLNQTDYSYNGGTGSCHDYFYENSMKKYNPSFDVYGPVKLSHGYAYYGEDKTGQTGQDQRAGEMIKEACQLLDNQIDFSQYDNDNDGYVDNVYAYFAGKGQHDGGEASSIWPHAHYLSYTDAGSYETDGVIVNRYATSNELQGNGDLVGIGVFCHEFSHVLGLPDLYDTYDSSAHTVGYWSVLSIGNYLNEGRTPPNMSAYERYALGWLTPNEFSKPEDISLQNINTNEAYIVNADNESNEYFLFENRQKLGWDSFLPGHGMLVWHIDYNQEAWEMNIVNTRKSHQYVDIEEADGQADATTYTGDSFPGTSGITSFTDETNPSMKSWAGNPQNKPITDINETSEGVITFKVMGGKRNLTETETETIETTPTSITLQWTPCSDCDFQLLSVYTKDGEIKKFVEDYNEKECEPTTSTLKLVNLKPSTTYYVSVTAATKYDKANVVENEITTLPPTFDMQQVVSKDATNITPTSFDANWEQLEGAESYLLTVKKRTVDNSIYEETADFTEKTLPSEWSSKASSYFSAQGYYGNAAPAISVAKNGDFIQSGNYKEIKSVSLWTRTMSYSSLSHLNIEGFNGRDWIVFGTINMAQTCEAGKTYVYSTENGTMEAGFSAIRLEYVSDAEKAGRMLIDDINIQYNKTDVDEVALGYDGLNVGNNLSKTVEGLEEKQLYVYTVQGVNGGLKSLDSKEIEVQLGDSKVTELNDCANQIILRNGLLEIWSQGNSDIKVFTTTGQTIISDKTDTAGYFAKNIVSGIYIVRINNKTYKIIGL